MVKGHELILKPDDDDPAKNGDGRIIQDGLHQRLQITIPSNPPTNYENFFVDTSDGLFKKQDDVGNISIYRDTPLNNYTAVTDPTTSNDNTQGYSVGSRWINVTLDRSFICLNSATASAIWRRNALYTPPLNIASSVNSITNSSTFVVGAGFEFPGSNSVGVPQAIRVFVANTNAGNTGEIRVFDDTNALQVAIATGYNETGGDTIALTITPANVPTSPANFQIQHRRASGGGSVIWDNVTFDF